MRKIVQTVYSAAEMLLRKDGRCRYAIAGESQIASSSLALAFRFQRNTHFFPAHVRGSTLDVRI